MQAPAEYRFRILFFVTLAICWVPVLRTLPGGANLLQFLLFVGLLAGVYAAAERNRPMVVAVSLATVAAIVRTAALADGSPVLWATASGLTVLFFGYIAFVTLSSVLRAPHITTDSIFGALATYLLVGISFAMAFVAIEYAVPGSLEGIAHSADIGVDGATGDIAPIVYFSFVTLTTLGYGDITPASTLVRHLALTEAVMGQLYLAVLVARLVGLKISADAKSG